MQNWSLLSIKCEYVECSRCFVFPRLLNIRIRQILIRSHPTKFAGSGSYFITWILILPFGFSRIRTWLVISYLNVEIPSKGVIKVFKKKFLRKNCLNVCIAGFLCELFNFLFAIYHNSYVLLKTEKIRKIFWRWYNGNGSLNK